MITKKEYVNTKEKVIDFLIGFFGIIVINYVLQFIFASILKLLLPQTTLSTFLNYLSGSLIIILYIGLITFFFKKRKYITIGILVQFIIYLLGGFFLALMFRGI